MKNQMAGMGQPMRWLRPSPTATQPDVSIICGSARGEGWWVVKQASWGGDERRMHEAEPCFASTVSTPRSKALPRPPHRLAQPRRLLAPQQHAVHHAGRRVQGHAERNERQHLQAQ